MVTRAEIIDVARSWKGTPWRHQGRSKGLGTDCVGFAIMVGIELGLLPAGADIKNYSRHPDPALLIKYLREFCDPTDRLIGGNLLLLCPSRLPQHAGIYTFEGKIIHAIDKVRGVREHRYDPQLLKRAGIYSYRGLAD